MSEKPWERAADEIYKRTALHGGAPLEEIIERACREWAEQEMSPLNAALDRCEVERLRANRAEIKLEQETKRAEDAEAKLAEAQAAASKFHAHVDGLPLAVEIETMLANLSALAVERDVAEAELAAARERIKILEDELGERASEDHPSERERKLREAHALSENPARHGHCRCAGCTELRAVLRDSPEVKP